MSVFGLLLSAPARPNLRHHLCAFVSNQEKFWVVNLSYLLSFLSILFHYNSSSNVLVPSVPFHWLSRGFLSVICLQSCLVSSLIFSAPSPSCPLRYLGSWIFFPLHIGQSRSCPQTVSFQLPTSCPPAIHIFVSTHYPLCLPLNSEHCVPSNVYTFAYSNTHCNVAIYV